MDWFNKLDTANKVMVGGLSVLFLAVIIVLAIALVSHQDIGIIDVSSPASPLDAGVDATSTRME